MARLNGIIAPVTTPFDQAGRLLPASFERNLLKYQDSPLSGIVVAGTTGEGIHLEPSERTTLVEVAVSALGGIKDILVGIPGRSLYQGLKEIEALTRFPLKAVLASVPSYYKPAMTDAALGDYFSSLADESPFPLLLYNIPKLTGIDLPVSLVKQLAQHPNVAGMKESSGNLIYLQEVLEATRDEEFEVVSGSAETFGSAVDLGVRAGILAVACAVPKLAAETLDPAGSDRAGTRRELFRAGSAIVAGGGVPGVKLAMDLCGYEGLCCRPPLGMLSDTARNRIEEAVLRANRHLSVTESMTAL